MFNPKVKLNEIKIGKSALTDEIYAGIMNKDNMSWKHKVNVTSFFLRACVDMFCGYMMTFTLNGKKYKVAFAEIVEEEVEDDQANN